MERLRFYLSHSANPGYKGLFSPADILHIELEEVSPPLTIQIANYTEYRQENSLPRQPSLLAARDVLRTRRLQLDPKIP